VLALENLEVLVEKKLVSLKVLVCGYLSLRVIGGVYQMVQNYLFPVLVALALISENLVNCVFSAKTRPNDNFELVKHQ
jgi:hypothetical protein